MKSLEMQIHDHFIHYIYGPDIVLIFACMLHWVIYLFHANLNKARNAANLHALVKLVISKGMMKRYRFPFAFLRILLYSKVSNY